MAQTTTKELRDYDLTLKKVFFQKTKQVRELLFQKTYVQAKQ
jgi:hypothetical protein